MNLRIHESARPRGIRWSNWALQERIWASGGRTDGCVKGEAGIRGSQGFGERLSFSGVQVGDLDRYDIYRPLASHGPRGSLPRLRFCHLADFQPLDPTRRALSSSKNWRDWRASIRYSQVTTHQSILAPLPLRPLWLVSMIDLAESAVGGKYLHRRWRLDG